MSKYWAIVASRDHVQRGIEGGFAQACHGKCAPLKRLKPQDGVIYYSSKERFGEPEPCQAFTAIGSVVDEDVFQVKMSENFSPFRRRVNFVPCRVVKIQPLIAELSFIKDKQHWGAPFRFGLLEIPEHDYQRIAQDMLQV
jgi:predicted RNA-binding protein